MKVNSVPVRTICPAEDMASVGIIDQRTLHSAFKTRVLRSVDICATAIRGRVRGAGLIGAAAGYGMLMAAIEAADPPPSQSQDHIERAVAELTGTWLAAVNRAGMGGETARSLATCNGRRRKAIRRCRGAGSARGGTTAGQVPIDGGNERVI